MLYKLPSTFLFTLMVSVFIVLSVVQAMFYLSDDVILPVAQASDHEKDLQGYMWSSTIGWVSMNCENEEVCDTSEYAVTLNTDTGTISGYGWSSNVGWLSFENADVVDCPSGECQPRISDGSVLGWARFISGTDSDDGWDGWVSLSCQNTNTCTQAEYGAVLDRSIGDVSGFVWGSDVVGWMDFSYASIAPEYELEVTINGQGSVVSEGTMCQSEDSSCIMFYDENDTVSIQANPASGWNFVEWTGLSVDDLSDTEATSNTITMDSNKSVTAVFEETGSGPGPGPGPGPGSVPPGPGPGPGGGPLDISCEATGDSVEEQNGETRSHVNLQITFTADVDPLTPGSTYTYDWSSVDIPQVESRTGESIDVLPRTIGDHTVEVEVEEKNSSGITLATATCEINHTVFIDPQYEEF